MRYLSAKRVGVISQPKLKVFRKRYQSSYSVVQSWSCRVCRTTMLFIRSFSFFSTGLIFSLSSVLSSFLSQASMPSSLSILSVSIVLKTVNFIIIPLRPPDNNTYSKVRVCLIQSVPRQIRLQKLSPFSCRPLFPSSLASLSPSAVITTFRAGASVLILQFFWRSLLLLSLRLRKS